MPSARFVDCRRDALWGTVGQRWSEEGKAGTPPVGQSGRLAGRPIRSAQLLICEKIAETGLAAKWGNVAGRPGRRGRGLLPARERNCQVGRWAWFKPGQHYGQALG